MTSGGGRGIGTGGRPAVAVALLAALAATFVAAVTVPGTAVAVGGTVALGGGIAHDSRRGRLAGATLLLAAVCYGAYAGLPVGVVLGGTVAALVAADAGERAVALDAHVPGASTGRVVGRGAGTTLAAGGVAAGVGYASFQVTAGEAPSGAAAVLVVGALLIAAALR